MKRQYKSLNLIDYLNNERLKSNKWKSNRSNYFQTRFDSYSTLYNQDGKGHLGCVNALDFSSNGLFLASGLKEKYLT